MVIVQIVYQYQEGYTFDWEYWSTKHRSLVQKHLLPYVSSVTRDFGVKGFKKDAPSILILSRLVFESYEEYEKIPQSIWDLIIDDVKNFTNLKPEISIASDEMVNVYE